MGKQVGGEDSGTKHRPLRYTVVDQGRGGGGAMEGDKLSSVWEVWLKQCQCTAGDAKVRKTFEEDSVGNGVKGSREVEEDEDTGLTGVCSDEKAIGVLLQSGLMCYGVLCMLTEEVQGFSGWKKESHNFIPVSFLFIVGS